MTLYATAPAGAAPVVAAAAPQPAKHKRHWWDKAIEGATGIAAGVITTGYHAVADPVMEVATGGEWDSQIDDIGKAIVDDYKHRYSSWDNFKSDPLAGVLDVLTAASAFFTLGGSLAVRGAAEGVQAGRLARIGGLAKDAHLTDLRRLTAGAPSDSAAARAYTKALVGRDLEANATLGRKGIIDSALSGSKSRVIELKDGTVLSPRQGILRGIDGAELQTVPLASSPYRRAMQQAGLKASNSKALNESFVGAQARAGKIANRAARIQDEATMHAVLGAGGAKAVRNAVKKMSKHEKAALYAKNTLGDLEGGNVKLADFLKRNADDLEAVMALPARAQRQIGHEAEIAAHVAKAASKGGKIDPAAAKAAALEHASGIMEELKGAEAAGNASHAERLNDKLKAAYEVAAHTQKPGFDEWAQKQYHLTNALRNADDVMAGLRERQLLLADDATSKVFANPTKHMLRVEKLQGRAAQFTTDFIRGDLNKGVRDGMADGTMLARMAVPDITDEELSKLNLIVRPHSRAQERAVNVREMRSQYDKRPTSPKTKPASVPEFSKHSRGYNFAFAQDSMSPAAVFKVWNEARAYKAKTRLLRAAAASGMRVTSDEQRAALKASGKYEFVGGDSELLGKAAVLRDKLHNEVRLIVGDSVVLDEADSVLGDLLAKHVEGAGEWAMPKVYYKHLSAELRRADNFVTRLVDTPTAIFRAAVLNLRPAWMVNNFVGQSMLLMYSQGVLHGVREYMTEAGRHVKAMRSGETGFAQVLTEKAGGLRSGAGTIAKEMGETGRMAEHGAGLGRAVRPAWDRTQEAVEKGGKAASIAAHTANLLTAPVRGVKGLADWMGHVNAILTDDIPRRAAFMGEVRPMLARVQKRHPELSSEEALKLVLADDHLTARLVDKVMGDLIDFSRMNQAEREVLRRVLPFYGWMKGITVRTGQIIKNDPHQALISYQLGQQYVAGAEERFGGPVPDNLLGALKLGEDAHGNPRIMPLNGMNNFQTPADILGMVGNLASGGGLKFGGTHPLSQVNPIIKAPLEVMTGRDFFFGGPLYSSPELGLGNLGVADKPWTPEDESRNNLNAIGARYLASLGPMALYQRYKKSGPFEDGDQRLLARSKGDSLSAYLGRPVATLNRDKAAQMAQGGTQYAIIGYNPLLGEKPGVFGGQQQPKATPPPIF